MKFIPSLEHCTAMLCSCSGK